MKKMTHWLLFYIGLSLLTILFGCGEERGIPGEKILTIYNSEMQETKTLSPLDTMYVKASKLSPHKYYNISIVDTQGQLVSEIEMEANVDGTIGPAPLWYDIGLTRQENKPPSLEIANNLDIMGFKVKVKSIDDDQTDFSQEMWIRYKNAKNSPLAPKPTVYASYYDTNDDAYYLENAFEESGSKKSNGVDTSDKTKIYVKAERVPEFIKGRPITHVDFFILPFTGMMLEDGHTLPIDGGISARAAVSRDSSGNGFVKPTLLWDLNASQKVVNPNQDNMAYSIVMDVDQNGIYDSGIDTNGDEVADSYIDGVDGLGIPGFIILNTPANDVFIKIKDGTGESALCTSAIPESGVDDQSLYFNMDNICFSIPDDTEGLIYLYVSDLQTDITDREVLTDIRKGAVYSIFEVSYPSDNDLRLLPYVEDQPFLNTRTLSDPTSNSYVPNLSGEDKQLDLVIDLNRDGHFDIGSDIFLKDSITILDMVPDPSYSTTTDLSGLNESKLFDESNTIAGNTIVYLKPSGNDENPEFDAYIAPKRERNVNTTIEDVLFKVTSSGNDTIQLWDLNGEFQVKNPSSQTNFYNIIIDNNQDGLFDQDDDLLTITIRDTRANTLPNVTYANVASGGSFGNTYRQHWTVYSKFCDYRDIFSTDARDTNAYRGYGIKAVFNPYFRWFRRTTEASIGSIYRGKTVDVYIVSKDNFDIFNCGIDGELSDEIDATGHHTTMAVQPSCYNGSGLVTVWHAPLERGAYYLIVDVNRNGRIDEGVDIIDAVNKNNESIKSDPSIVGFKVVGKTGVSHGNFGVTKNKYKDTSDWNAAIKSEFGDEYEVADWNDLKRFVDEGGDIALLFDSLGLTKHGDSGLVLRNGNKKHNSWRWYFATRHDQNKPGFYLAHDNIENYQVSLGSWYTTSKIIAVKKSY